MENRHQSECANDSEATRDWDGYPVNREGVADRSIRKGGAWGGKGVVPCFRPVDFVLVLFPSHAGQWR